MNKVFGQDTGHDAKKHIKDIPLEGFAVTLHKLRMLEADEFNSLIEKVA